MITSVSARIMARLRIALTGYMSASSFSLMRCEYSARSNRHVPALGRGSASSHLVFAIKCPAALKA